MLAVLLLDAALDLSDFQRAALPALLAIGAGAVIIWLAFKALVMTRNQIARRVERANRALGNRLSNALAFEREQGATPIEEVLRQETIELGLRTAATVRAWPLLRGRLVTALVMALAAIALWAATAWLAPDVLQAT